MHTFYYEHQTNFFFKGLLSAAHVILETVQAITVIFDLLHIPLLAKPFSAQLQWTEQKSID